MLRFKPRMSRPFSEAWAMPLTKGINLKGDAKFLSKQPIFIRHRRVIPIRRAQWQFLRLSYLHAMETQQASHRISSSEKVCLISHSNVLNSECTERTMETIRLETPFKPWASN